MRQIIFSVLLLALLCSCGSQKSIESERLDCMERMQKLCEFIDSYMSNKVGFPPASNVDKQGRVLHSWRFFILEYSTAHLAKYPSESWPDPAYEIWETGYAASSARSLFTYDLNRSEISNPSNNTNFLALVGPGTAFTEYCVDKDRRTRDVEPDAILLVECDSNIHWIEPGDIEIASILNSTSKTGLGDVKGNFPNCFAVAFADSTIWFLKDTVPANEIGKFLTVESAKQHDREDVLKDFVLQKLAPFESK